MNFSLATAPAQLRIVRQGVAYDLPAAEARRVVYLEELQAISAGVYFGLESGLPLLVLEPSVLDGQMNPEVQAHQDLPKRLQAVVVSGRGDVALALVADEVSLSHSSDNPGRPLSLVDLSQVESIYSSS